MDETGAPSPGSRGRAGRPYEGDDAFDEDDEPPDGPPPRPPPPKSTSARPSAGRASWAAPGPPPAPRASIPAGPTASLLNAVADDDGAALDDDDALLDDDDLAGSVLGGLGQGTDDGFDDDDDDDDDDDLEDDDDDDEDEDEDDDIYGSALADARGGGGPTDSMEDDVDDGRGGGGGRGVLRGVPDVEDLMADVAAASAAASARAAAAGSGSTGPPAQSVLDAAIAGVVAGDDRPARGRGRAVGPADAGGGGGGVEDDDGDGADAPPMDYPTPPHRERTLADLLSAVGIDAAAYAGDPADPGAVVVAGVESDPAAVRPGDLLAWRGPPPRSGPAAPPAYPDFYRGSPAATAGEAVAAAAAAGAAAAVVVAGPGSDEDAHPAAAAAALSARAGGLPVVIVSASSAAAAADAASAAAAAAAQAVADGRPAGAGAAFSTLAGGGPAIAGPPAAAVGTALAAEFYGSPGACPDLFTIALVGGPGKTTTAWLLRGILEEAGALVALVDSSEYAIHADRLDASGDLWSPSVPDPTADRACSAAFHLAPYEGKYPEPEPCPDGVRLVRVLAGARDRGATVAVVSLGAGALAAGAGAALSPNVLLHTGPPVDAVTGAPCPPDSPEVEALAAAFGALVDPDRQTAVLNLDDPGSASLLAALGASPDGLAGGAVPSLSYGLYNKGADVHCQKSRVDLWDTEVLVAVRMADPDAGGGGAGAESAAGGDGASSAAATTPAGTSTPPPSKVVEVSVSTTLLGRTNIYNVLAAVAGGLTARVGGARDGGNPAGGGGLIDLATIAGGILATEVIPGRCESIDEGQPFAVVVDAAATAAALGGLLDGLREAGAKRVITLVSADGDTPRAGRPFLGEAAHYKSDIVIVSNGNPRSEAPDAIAADVCAGFPVKLLAANARAPYPPGFLQDPGRVDSTTLDFLMDKCWRHQRYVCEDRWMAIRWAIGTAGPDDVVVLAGKGAQDYAEWADWDVPGRLTRGWFDDRVEARNALARAPSLWAVTELDRSELPWLEWEERGARVG